MSQQRTYYSREAEQAAQQQRLVLAGVVMVLGLSIGTILAMLFAPRSGEETRRELADNAEKALDSGREATNKLIVGLQQEVARLRKDIEERMRHAEFK